MLGPDDRSGGLVAKQGNRLNAIFQPRRPEDHEGQHEEGRNALRAKRQIDSFVTCFVLFVPWWYILSCLPPAPIDEFSLTRSPWVAR